MSTLEVLPEYADARLEHMLRLTLPLSECETVRVRSE